MNTFDNDMDGMDAEKRKKSEVNDFLKGNKNLTQIKQLIKDSFENDKVQKELLMAGSRAEKSQ